MLGEWFDDLLGVGFGGLLLVGPEGALGGIAIGVYGRWCGGFGKRDVSFFFMILVVVVGWHFASGLVSCSSVET